jgi:hypothetical protein
MLDKSESSGATIRQLITDQLLAAAPASLSRDVLIRGLGCAMGNPDRNRIIDILGEMETDRTIVKIVEDHYEPRFTLIDRSQITHGEFTDD